MRVVGCAFIAGVAQQFSVLFGVCLACNTAVDKGTSANSARSAETAIFSLRTAARLKQVNESSFLMVQHYSTPSVYRDLPASTALSASCCSDEDVAQVLCRMGRSCVCVCVCVCVLGHQAHAVCSKLYTYRHIVRRLSPVPMCYWGFGICGGGGGG